MKYCLKSGFTIIELIIVILIIGLLFSIGLPRFLNTGISGADKFIARLNKLTLEGAQKAQKFNKIYKVFINMAGKKIELLPNILNKESTKSSNPELTETIPDSIELLDFFIDNKSQFTSSSSIKKNAYFLINSAGITQDTKVLFKDNNPKSKRGSYEILLNPFMAQFKLL